MPGRVECLSGTWPGRERKRKESASDETEGGKQTKWTLLWRRQRRDVVLVASQTGKAWPRKMRQRGWLSVRGTPCVAFLPRTVPVLHRSRARGCGEEWGTCWLDFLPSIEPLHAAPYHLRQQRYARLDMAPIRCSALLLPNPDNPRLLSPPPSFSSETSTQLNKGV